MRTFLLENAASATTNRLLRATALLLLFAVPELYAQESTARIDSAFVERGRDGILVAHWTTVPADIPVAIYAGTDPDAISRKNPIVEARGASRRAVLPAHSDSTQRYYFQIVPAGSSEGYVVAERHLPLAGATNFRDLGGYRAADGRRVRWGTVFRSGNLAGLTGQDLRLFSEIGVKMVCDLRRPQELAAFPDRYPKADPPETMHLDISGHSRRDTAATTSAVLRNASAGETTVGEMMAQGYRHMVIGAAPLYARMIEQLQEPANRPFLFHCQGGQDRTGIGAALLLTALDVPRETIVRDYLLTNRYRMELDERALKRYAAVYDIPIETLRELIRQDVTAQTIQAAFEAVADAYGSTDAYLQAALGLTDTERAHLQAALLR